MIRYGLGVLVAAGACTAVCVAACGDTIKDPGIVVGNTGAGGDTGSGGSVGSGGAPNLPDGSAPVSLNLKCQGPCCPTGADTAACYSDPAKGVESRGSECQATRDNTDQTHIQMRQAWIRATTPLGNTNSVVYGVLSDRTQLPEPACYQGLNQASNGAGGYIQLIDFFLGGKDIEKHYSTVGYSTYVPPSALATTLSDGFCYGEEVYHGQPKYTSYGLTTDSIRNPNDVANYPKGLPLPMGLADPGGWKVGSTKAKRVADDFDVAKDRVVLLGKLAAGGEYGLQGFNGVFYYNDKTGYAHGYGSMGWTIVYASDGLTHLAIPIREVETKSTFNDPVNPNCVGAFRADKLKTSTGCSSNDPKNPAWGCLNTGPTAPLTCPGGEGPASTTGYFLITELEQLYSADLSSTLCVSYPGKFTELPDHTVVPDLGTGFYTGAARASCKGPAWDPTKTDGSGIPKGDWCAATNSAAHDNCHDAWQSKSFHVFVAGKIKGVPDDPATPLPTCAF